jgi:hypothetical protein
MWKPFLSSLAICLALASIADARPSLGVLAMPVFDPVLRAQLQLPEGEGLIVEEVVPGSAAEEAGFQRYDILLSVNGEKLASPHDLHQRVAQEPIEALTFELIRGGQKQTLEVTPRDEPARGGNRIRIFRGEGGAANADALIQMFTTHDPMEVPQGMTVRITRKAGEPAKIVIEQANPEGGEPTIHEATAETIDQLPAHLQRMARHMIGNGPFTVLQGGWVDLSNVPAMPAIPGVPRVEHRFGGEAQALTEEARKEVQTQLDELRQQMEQLREELKQRGVDMRERALERSERARQLGEEARKQAEAALERAQQQRDNAEAEENE